MKRINLLFFVALLSFSLQAQDESGHAIYVDVYGEGDPILLIPGFTVPGDIWTPLVDELKSDYECHVVTLAGFGNKAPISFPWLPQVNAAIEDYIAAQALNDLTVIGHSLGGTIASWLASRENNLISEIILVDALPAAGAIMFPDFDPDKLAYESPYNDQQLAMSEADFEQLAGMMAGGMSLNRPAQVQITEWITTADRQTYVYGYTDYLKLDMREDLKRISAPVTILAADQPYGSAMVTQTYQNQYTNLSEYELVIAENSAHFIMLDQPEWFLSQIKIALASK
ncbi:MAG: alpha/beta hydrolase [Bacteroidota bacterium]